MKLSEIYGDKKSDHSDDDADPADLLCTYLRDKTGEPLGPSCIREHGLATVATWICDALGVSPQELAAAIVKPRDYQLEGVVRK